MEERYQIARLPLLFETWIKDSQLSIFSNYSEKCNMDIKCVGICTCKCRYPQSQGVAVWSPRAEGTSSYECGARNQIQVLTKSVVPALNN